MQVGIGLIFAVFGLSLLLQVLVATKILLLLVFGTATYVKFSALFFVLLLQFFWIWLVHDFWWGPFHHFQDFFGVVVCGVWPRDRGH